MQLHRQGKCTWTLSFRSDGTEVGSTSYHNEDVSYPNGGRGGHLGDQMIKVITDGRIDQQQVPGGSLSYQRAANGQYTWDYVIPGYKPSKTEYSYTWDSFRNEWSLQMTNFQEMKDVTCAPTHITGASSGYYGPAPPKQHIKLSEQVTNVILWQQWTFYLPINQTPKPRPGITQNPPIDMTKCAAILQEEDRLSQEMIFSRH